MCMLKELWHNFGFSDMSQMEENGEFYRLNCTLGVRRAQMKKELSLEGNEALEVFERAKDTMAQICEENAFEEGFRMGARMMIDVLGE